MNCLVMCVEKGWGPKDQGTKNDNVLELRIRYCNADILKKKESDRQELLYIERVNRLTGFV